MILLWNRKEVFAGNSLQKFNEVRQRLDANGVAYKYNMVDITSRSRGRAGTFGINLDYSITYYIYVNKKDYDAAYAAIQTAPC